MSIASLTALYVIQAVFWVWLQREVARDRPRGDPLHERSLAASLWRFDSSTLRWTSWTLLIVSTIGYVTGVIVLAMGR